MTHRIFRLTCAWLVAIALALTTCGCAADYTTADDSSTDKHTAESVDTSNQSPDLPRSTGDQAETDVGESLKVPENGTYTSKDEVARYIHQYGHLPSNFISKTKAREAGWVSSEGNLDEVCPGMSIGGSQFHNDDGLLPDAQGRTWTECDINYEGGYRGSERIVFSNDGLIYYTDNHYSSFERLY